MAIGETLRRGRDDYQHGRRRTARPRLEPEDRQGNAVCAGPEDGNADPIRPLLNRTETENISISGLGSTVSKVTFIVYHDYDLDSVKNVFHKYSYTSSGSFNYLPVEIKYDLTNPTGYLDSGGITSGDSVAVYFDGVPVGANLDSIKVALR